MSHRKAVASWLALALLAAAVPAQLAAAEEPAATSEPPPIPVSISIWDSPLRARVEKALAEPIDVDFQDTPLDEAIETLAKRHAIPIRVVRAALHAEGIPGDHPVRLRASGIPLRLALRSMLNELDLTYVIEHDALVITTTYGAEARPEMRLYPVRDLVDVSDAGGFQDYGTLIEFITACINPVD